MDFLHSELVLVPIAGARIDFVCAEAVKAAKLLNAPVGFLFNDTPAVATAKDTPESVERDWARTRAKIQERDRYARSPLK